MNIAVCIIISKNYIPHARALAASLRAQYQQPKIYCLFLDDFKNYIDPRAEGFEAFTLADLKTSDWEFFDRIQKQGVFEISCLMKARFLKFLLLEHNEKILFYLDTDLYFYHNLDVAIQTLQQHNILLTPQILEANQDTSRESIMHELYSTGTGLYNLGFIGVKNSTETIRFLDWWNAKNSFYCGRTKSYLTFYDQKWIDPVHIFFKGVHVSKDLGMNVANWNLHERPIELRDKKYWIKNKPLIFFHFSQFDPLQNKTLAKYSKIQMKDFKNLKSIVQNYKHALMQNGWQAAQEWKFSGMYELGTH